MSSPTPSPEPTPPSADEAPPAGGAPRWRLRRRQPEVPDASVPAPPLEEDEPPVGVAQPQPEGAGKLRRRRRQLLTEREEAVYHLGGLAFELYRRDLLGERVMRHRAAEVWGLDENVRDIDLQLEQIERTRRERREERRRKPPPEPAPLGHCVNCGSPWYQADARFCWSCGQAITHPEGAPAPEEDDDRPTTVISDPEEGS